MNEITYAGQPLVDAPGTCFVLPSGGAPGHGVFDVDAEAFARIQAALETSAGAADLVMTDGERTVRLKNIYLVSAEPVVTRRGGVAGSQGVASWRITLADRRSVLAMRTISGRYNILKPDRERYFADTANGSETAPWTWQDLVDSLAGALDLDLDLAAMPAGSPADVVWDSDAPLELLHELLAEVGQYLTYDPLSGTASDWNIHKVGAPDADELRALNDLLRAARTEGAGAIRATRALAPASVDVLFPIYDTSLAGPRLDPDDRWYAVNRPAPAGVRTISGSRRGTYYNHAYARREEGDVVNAEALATIATARADEFYAQVQVEHADYELAGLHALAPNSIIRRVIWLSDESGARTLVRVGNPDVVDRSYRTHRTHEQQKPQEGDGLFIQRGHARARFEVDTMPRGAVLVWFVENPIPAGWVECNAANEGWHGGAEGEGGIYVQNMECCVPVGRGTWANCPAAQAMDEERDYASGDVGGWNTHGTRDTSGLGTEFWSINDHWKHGEVKDHKHPVPHTDAQAAVGTGQAVVASLDGNAGEEAGAFAGWTLKKVDNIDNEPIGLYHGATDNRMPHRAVIFICKVV